MLANRGIQLSPKFSLIQNIEYWERKKLRESKRHKQSKLKAKNIGETAHHGTADFECRETASLLGAIRERLIKETLYYSVKAEHIVKFSE